MTQTTGSHLAILFTPCIVMLPDLTGVERVDAIVVSHGSEITSK